jgi:hypothetical protein
LKLTFSTGLLDESDHHVHVPVADVFLGHNNHTSVIVLSAIDAIHERRDYATSDATSDANVGQHSTSGDINDHERNSRCCDFFL